MDETQNVLRIGTDCSGIEAPIQALLQLNIPFRHMFSSDIDKHVIKSIKANYHPEIIFGDITKRNIEDVPDIDLYIAGFPCQPFSTAGRRKGFEDERGNVFWSCLEVIERKRPRYFILENVRGLLNHDKGNTWAVIWEALSGLEGYNVDWKILNTRHYGIPQNRERIYIVGTKGEFEWPEEKEMDDLRDYIDNDDISTHPIRPGVLKNGFLNKVPDDAIFVDFSFQQNTHPNSGIFSPCITADSRLWNVPKHRYANIKERLSLQGFPTDFIQVVSNTQMKKQIGNSMSVNVLKEILENLLKVKNVIRVGTDCSGIEAPIQALIQLNIPFRHMFSSDIDKHVIKSIKANYHSEIIFGDKDGPYPEGDITKRNIEDIPDIDLYVAGFPCQPFSMAGRRKGFEDERGNVFWSCLEVIERKRPRYFILENVRGLLNHDKKNTWNVIWKSLSELEDYNVKWKILNTKDYGIPQNRERIFIVGTQGEFEWPKHLPLQDISQYVDDTDNNSIVTSVRHEDILERLEDGKFFIVLAYGVAKTRKHIDADKFVSCITTQNAIWCIPKHRYINVKECCKLQGFPTDFIQVVSNTQMKKQIGNSMSVNVLKEILNNLL